VSISLPLYQLVAEEAVGGFWQNFGNGCALFEGKSDYISGIDLM